MGGGGRGHQRHRRDHLGQHHPLQRHGLRHDRPGHDRQQHHPGGGERAVPARRQHRRRAQPVLRGLPAGRAGVPGAADGGAEHQPGHPGEDVGDHQ